MLSQVLQELSWVLCNRLLLLFLQFIAEVKIYSILRFNFLVDYYTNLAKASARKTVSNFVHIKSLDLACDT